MEFVDTHCHIQSAGADRGERTTHDLWQKAPELQPASILAHAEDANVAQMICVGCDLDDSKLAIEFAGEHDNCSASIGIHPHEAQHYYKQAGSLLEEFAALTSRSEVVAVGECGLDFYYTHSPKEAQVELLRFQIELALAHDLPMIFHVREAFDDFWPVFENYQGIRGVLHSFTDSQANLDRALGHGLYIGVNGIATFARGEAQQKMYQSIPLQKLLLETDAPFLTPIPFRGTICEPKHVRTTAEFLSELRGELLEELATQTTQNARTLFSLQ